jgi:SAM-dependent methyltransferase
MDKCSKAYPMARLPQFLRAVGSITLTSVFGIGCFSERATEPAPTTYQLITGEDFEDVRSQWDQIHSTKQWTAEASPSDIVRDHLELLPKGKVLDIAMGEGKNSVYLAKKGFITEGVDISEVALRKAKLLAKQNHVSIITHAMPMEEFYIRPESYDVILDIRFFRKPLLEPIKKGLRKGGVIVFEHAHPKNLGKERSQNSIDLKEQFSGFEILVYRQFDSENESVTQLVAKKL